MGKIETYRNQTLQGKSLSLDETVFLECKLIDCDFYYSGGDFEAVNCQMENCRFHWRGPAKNTLAMLQTMGMLKTPTPIAPQGFAIPPGTKLN